MIKIREFYYSKNLFKIVNYEVSNTPADWARSEAAEAEVLEADESGLVNAQILGAAKHCFLLFVGCFRKAGPKADTATHSEGLAVAETLQHVGFPLYV